MTKPQEVFCVFFYFLDLLLGKFVATSCKSEVFLFSTVLEITKSYQQGEGRAQKNHFVTILF
ncbi:MAG TPA: hypothetical protein DDW73_17400 [Rhizobium sp.]|nr:hypothetical protein [Rhizobium sp.]